MVWSLNISDGLEIDEYDDERAMYAIAFDVEGKVAISGRFRPADDRSMLVDHFAHVLPADIGPINNAKTWEARSEEITSELQSLMRTSYAVFCLKKKKNHNQYNISTHQY